MNYLLQIFIEQYKNLHLIFRLAVYEEKAKYKMHYLGPFWQILNPALQIFVYWFVFGIGLRAGAPVDGIPFFLWLIVGIVPWLFINQTLIQGANCVYSKIQLIARMKFPVSVLPGINLAGNTISFIVFVMIIMGLLLMNGIYPGYYLLQLPYYIICLYVLIFGLTLLLSTMTIIIRDIQTMVQYMIRLMMYLLPIVWNMDKLPKTILSILRLNPFYYIIEGFRNSFLGEGWFFADMRYTVYFWLFTFFILFLGAFVHIRFRNKFVDYI